MEHQEKQVTNNSPAKSTNSSLHPDQSKVGARPRTRSWDGFSNLPNNHPGSQLQFNALKCAMSPAECKKTARLPLPLVQAKFGKEPGEDPTSILPPDRKDSTIFETWRKRNYTSPKIFNRNSLFPYNHGPVTRYQQSDPTREVRLLQSENLSQNHRHTVAPVLSTFSPKVTKKPGYSNAVVTNPTVLPMHMSQPLGANRDCLINPTQKRCHSEPPPEARFVAQAKDKIPEMAKQPHQIFGTSLKQTPNVNKPNELTSITDRLQQRSEEAALSVLSLNPTFPIIKNSFGDRKASEISKVADDHLPKRTAPSTEILRLSFTSVPNSSATQNQACTTVTTFASGFEPLTVYRPTLSPTSRPASAALNDQEMTLGRKSVNRYNSWNNRMLSHDFETLNVPEPDRDLLIHSSSLSRQRDVPSLRVDRPFIPYLNEQTMTGYLRVGTNSDLQPSMPKESSRIAQALKNQTPESSQSRLNNQDDVCPAAEVVATDPGPKNPKPRAYSLREHPRFSTIGSIGYSSLSRKKSAQVSFNLEKNQCFEFQCLDTPSCPGKRIEGYISSSGDTPGEGISHKRWSQHRALRNQLNREGIPGRTGPTLYAKPPIGYSTVSGQLNNTNGTNLCRPTLLTGYSSRLYPTQFTAHRQLSLASTANSEIDSNMITGGATNGVRLRTSGDQHILRPMRRASLSQMNLGQQSNIFTMVPIDIECATNSNKPIRLNFQRGTVYRHTVREGTHPLPIDMLNRMPS
ncbi:hypothetical protein AHF37_04893 [Paragonimus kellicotti]|nr:hypothetical protein AHF37_04893 [Paragonimus kellicotti]